MSPAGTGTDAHERVERRKQRIQRAKEVGEIVWGCFWMVVICAFFWVVFVEGEKVADEKIAKDQRQAAAKTQRWCERTDCMNQPERTAEEERAAEEAQSQFEDERHAEMNSYNVPQGWR